MNQDEINSARVVFYGLFASVFTYFETDKNFKALQNTVDLLSQNPLDSNSATALLNMKSILDEKGFKALKDEANIVFYSPSTAYIPMSASYYCEARDDGKKRQEMLELVNLSNFRRDTKTYKDNEDNIAFMFNFMNHLIQNTLDGDNDSEKITRGVFERVLNEVVDQFASNVHEHVNSDFYKSMAIVLKVFIEYERQLYSLNPVNNYQAREVIKTHGNKEKVAAQEKAKRNFDEFKTL
ncbi:molecular chaperone [Sulfurimonas sp.]|uniref:TorD/DmsD family molecular chaperone n=1 Tax=Sulfurimonas sp. TaxID=2022749 RepID=UPI0025CE60A5|nr:molecular chaperone TorD family protein [Sulfurimonas sp.]